MTDPEARPAPFLWVVVIVFALMLASFVIGALRRPPIPEAGITPPAPVTIGDSLVGPATVTLDATHTSRWTYFDFSRNAAVQNPGPLDWDLAVRRFHLIVNGGSGFAGRGGVASLGDVALDSVREVPEQGYAPTTSDSTHPVTARWYAYGYTTHLLQTKGETYAVRTADGRYAVVRVVSYYCGEAQPGCLTLRYIYQGDGSRHIRGTGAPGHRRTENRTPNTEHRTP